MSKGNLGVFVQLILKWAAEINDGSDIVTIKIKQLKLKIYILETSFLTSESLSLRRYFHTETTLRLASLRFLKFQNNFL